MIENYDAVLSQATLSSSRLMLRKFQSTDAEAVFEYGSDAKVLEHLDWCGVKTLEEAKNSISEYYMKTSGAFAIECNRKCVGSIELRPIFEHDKISFGYALCFNEWNKGIMSEALKMLIDFSFCVLKVNRFEGKHYLDNPASGRVMQKCGMVFEGIGREEIFSKHLRDVAHYAILKKEYFARP